MKKLILPLLLLFGLTDTLLAQRISYPQLVYRSHAPEIFINDIILPGEDGNTKLVFLFRFNNDFIPFKKLPLNNDLEAPEKAEFYSTIRLNSEIFPGELKRRGDPSANSISRDFWADTLFANSFEETKSKDHFAAGFLETELAPGMYNFILQLSMMQEDQEQNTRRREVRVPDLHTSKTGEVYLIRNFNPQATPLRLELMNMEHNVPFGKDFYAAIRIPEYDDAVNYSVRINKAQISRKDTTSKAEVYSADVKANEIYDGASLSIHGNASPYLVLHTNDGNYTYLVTKISASTFENSGYILTLSKEGQDTPVARRFFRSYWSDMPASLYNLDISIRHLRYILSEDEVKHINSGNDKEREKKFRAFWEQRDPTPNTVYNELMAEYYRRIDYAFNEFGSQENPMGHESDQGEVYIKFGPPQNKERRFPERGRTIEVWEYPNRTFVFEASSGFGDFKLVGTK